MGRARGASVFDGAPASAAPAPPKTGGAGFAPAEAPSKTLKSSDGGGENYR